MSKRFTLLIAVVAGLGVLVTAGCGGSSRNKAYANDKVAFALAMNGICARVNAEQKTIGSPSSLSDAADKIPQIQDSLDKAIKDLEKLQPPDEIKGPVEDFISIGKQLAAKLSDLKKAAEDNDEAKFTQIADEGDALNKKADGDDIKAIGAPACLSTSS